MLNYRDRRPELLLLAPLALVLLAYARLRGMPDRALDSGDPAMPLVLLNNGLQMPMLSAGLWQVTPEEATAMIPLALRVGYNHIDASINYGNQPEVGEALKGVDRSSYFMLTKIDPDWPDYEKRVMVHMTDASAFNDTTKQLYQCLDDLQTDYVDMMLMHWAPKTCKATQESWRAMEAFYNAGLAKAIGVSNFCSSDIACLMETAKVVPAMNQIQLHVGMGPKLSDIRKYHEPYEITVQAYSPLGAGTTGKPRTPELITGDLVTSIGAKYGKSGAQVSLRWLIQHGFPTAVESTVESHLRSDLDIFDFELSAQDMATLDEQATPAGGNC